MPLNWVYEKESNILHNSIRYSLCKKCDMEHLVDNGELFNNFPYTCEALDVVLQKGNRPSGNMQKGKLYVSGKHKLYCHRK